ncbi:MAG: hypothetical protein CMN34_03425 [Saprospirales bacterium]|nr:hypothetical protein [Saprospirales bacterium]
MDRIYTFQFQFTWPLVQMIRNVERIHMTWKSRHSSATFLENRREEAGMSSVVSCAKIEGLSLSSEDLSSIKRQSFDDFSNSALDFSRGLLDVYAFLDSASPEELIEEDCVKKVHELLTSYMALPDAHKGEYKSQDEMDNKGSAALPTLITFRTTNPNELFSRSMSALFRWTKDNDNVDDLVKASLMAYEIYAVDAFNSYVGTLGRLMAGAYLKSRGYNWIVYLKLEREFELRHREMQQIMAQCKMRRPNEDITPWIEFYLECLLHALEGLPFDTSYERIKSANPSASDETLSPREERVLRFIEANPGTRSGEISQGVNIPVPTIKKMMAKFYRMALVNRFGQGRGTHYAMR